jgi:MFS family permease
MVRDAYRLAALFTSVVILNLGTGILSTLLSLRASIEGFPDAVTGIVMALYFLGLVLGAFYSGHLVARVGHIRTFAGLAAVTAASTLAYVLVVSPVAWGILRVITGFCMAGIYMVVESWLNEQATAATRGRYLAIYMTLNLAALAASQFMLPLASPAGFQLFSVSAILLCLALVPVVLARIQAPDPAPAQRLSVVRLYGVSPLGAITCLIAGMTIGSFWGVGPIFARRTGLDEAGIAAFMAAVLFGGLMLQWPIGWLSDHIDRRKMIAGVCVTAALAALGMSLVEDGDTAILLPLAFVFGGTLYPIYSLGVSHVNDFVEPGDFVLASSGLLFLYGCGAALGPIMAGTAMEVTGASGFPWYQAAILLLLMLIAIRRMSIRPTVPVEEREAAVALPRTTPLVFELDPRAPEPEPPPEDEDTAPETSAPSSAGAFR